LTSTRGLGVSITHLSLFHHPLTELDYDLSIAGNSDLQGEQFDKLDEGGSYSLESFHSPHVTR
jgi:hypothetical protein